MNYGAAIISAGNIEDRQKMGMIARLLMFPSMT
jgi:hypothetical protein